MTTTRASRAPFAAIDVTVSTFTTGCLFSAISIVYWGIQLSSEPGSSSAAVLIASLTVVVVLALTWIASPLTWLLGRMLRNVSRRWVHLATFGVVGTGVSVPLLWIGSAFTPYENTPRAFLWVVVAAALSGLCALAGRAAAFSARRRREIRALAPEPEDVLWNEARSS